VPRNDSGCPAYSRDTRDKSPIPTLDDPEAISALGSLLQAAGYTADGLKESLGVVELGTAAADVPAYLQRLNDSSPRTTLIRLFFLGVPQAWQDLAAALPGLDPDRLEAIGVLEAVGDDVRALVRLVPYRDVVVAYPAGAEPPDDAALLANITVRMHFVSALQVESGPGLHSLLAATHTERAIAVDSDPSAVALVRVGALLNGLEGIEALEGERLEPVAGHSFGLIVASPPRILTPDDDERADSLCREVVRGVAGHLSEGGFAHVHVTWVLGTGEDWWAPLEPWMDGTGCDAIFLLEREDDPVAYAAAHADPQALERWVGFLRDLAAARIASGILVLRRRSRGSNWTHHEALPGPVRGPAGDQLVRAFVNHDLLASLPTDDQLLDEVLAVVEPQRIEQTWRHRNEGLGLESARARLDWGLGFEVDVDTYTIELLARIDGHRRLRDLFAEIARDSQLEEDSLAHASLPAVRRLLQLGFLARAS